MSALMTLNILNTLNPKFKGLMFNPSTMKLEELKL